MACFATGSEWLRPPSQDAAVVVGRLGGRVELACGAAEPRGEVGDDEPSLLLWFHESRPATPLYSVDGRQAGGLAVSPHNVSITDELGAEMRGTVGPFNDGDPLDLFCTAHGIGA
ncbi:hypothetical protein MTO96_034643 [Rhipicephalus appendiculatus]